MTDHGDTIVGVSAQQQGGCSSPEPGYSITPRPSTSPLVTGTPPASPPCSELGTADSNSDSLSSTSDVETVSSACDGHVVEPAPPVLAYSTDGCTDARGALPTWLQDSVKGLESSFDELRGALHGFLRADAGEPALHERQRDIFPLPLVNIDIAHRLAFSCGDEACPVLLDLLVRVANLAIHALNALSGFRAPLAQLGVGAPQRAGQRRALDQASKWVASIRACDPPAPSVAFGRLVHDDELSGIKTVAPALDALRCDLLESSGEVDPLPFAAPEHRAVVETAETLFPVDNLDWVRAGRIALGDRPEYAKLVVRQLRSHKVGLLPRVTSSASIFTVGKSSGGLREVWNGHDLSTLAALPPKPPHLAGVTALVDLEADASTPVVAYKRDARCFFDQLLLPTQLRAHFGRPWLRCSDIFRYTNMNIDELSSHLWPGAICDGDLVLHPCCATWPMGFSWSSFLAQSTLLAALSQAGFTADHMLADDIPPPRDLDLCVSLATDDIMLFSRGSSSRARAAISRIDRAVSDLGVQAHHGKDVNESTSCTLIGVELQDGRRLAPASDKLALVLVGIVFMLRDSSVLLSPLDLQTVLGHFAWFALLARPIFSTLHEVYADARRIDTTSTRPRDECLAELLLFMMLMPFVDADLTRPWSDIIVASDASPSFGFGVSVAPASADDLRAFSRTAARRGAFARLERDGSYPDEEVEKPRKGRACPLPINKAAFATVVSSRAVHAAHAGALEAGGVRLALRWYLRSVARHGTRMVLLVDAQAVLGAVSKGRSSSGTLRREIMRIAALQLVGGLLLKLVYVPSEDNPADAPSRGVVRRWRPRRNCIARSKKQVLVASAKRKREYAASHAERHCERILRRSERIRRTIEQHGGHYPSSL